MSDPKLPNPDEIQRQWADFMKTAFAGNSPFPAAVGTPEEAPQKAAETEETVFEFSLQPRDIKAHLDRFVIRQDEAKKVLAIAVCDHYHHVQNIRQLEQSDPETAAAIEHAKQNVLLLGPTGVGKTYLIKHIAELIGVPFVKADATKFSETGYVGGDVDDLARELLRKADGDLELAQFGIIYIDEIDKIAAAQQGQGRDVSGRGVQMTLLKLMEETEVPTRNPMDIQAQLQAAMEMTRGGKSGAKETLNTRHVLFIVSGAFDKLGDQIRRRLSRAEIGFAAKGPAGGGARDVFSEATTTDFVEYGFEPEFIGRLPVRVVCDELSAEDLFEILKRSEGSLLHQYERDFRAYGIGVEFRDEALREISARAALEKTGARGLLTVCEKLFRDFKYELPGSGLESFVVDDALVGDPAAVLGTLLAEGRKQEEAGRAERIRAFCQSFGERHGVSFRLGPGAVEALIARADAEEQRVTDLCEALFKDYPYGLKLILQNRPGQEFELPAEAVSEPDKYLSDLVVKSYQTG